MESTCTPSTVVISAVAIQLGKHSSELKTLGQTHLYATGEVFGLMQIRWEKNITLGEPPGFLHSWWWYVSIL
ncbi:hypothetical protein DNTS_025885 [Danionella cerebrum]|uniref:Uncharacterized protein n=1 Tax=Danionella cerebrum TaxID=2873325 RepID=A0A553NAD5_9TELE|nr:hypothetical protein DNTS_025885 [Danionella translucida]